MEALVVTNLTFGQAYTLPDTRPIDGNLTTVKVIASDSVLFEFYDIAYHNSGYNKRH